LSDICPLVRVKQNFTNRTEQVSNQLRQGMSTEFRFHHIV
jgi:hypothetical protein